MPGTSKHEQALRHAAHFMHVAIVGAGLAGLCAAHYLREGGAKVSVFERAEGPGLATSFANGSLLHPGSVEPWNQPGVLTQLLKNLGNRESAMLLRLHALPGLLGWGLRFVRESSPERFRANTRANVALANHSLALMQTLKQQGVDYHAYRRGSLTVVRNTQALAEMRQWREWMLPQGVPFEMLDTDACVALEPALHSVALELVGGILQPADEGGDPKRFNDSLAASLRARGVAIYFNRRVSRVLCGARVVEGLVFEDGRSEKFDAVVLAAASWSTPLAATAGLRLPVKPVKGYSLTLPRTDAAGHDRAPSVPVLDPTLHMAVVPVGDDRVRVAGTAEFTGFDTHIDAQRVANLRRLIARLYPPYMAGLPQGAGTAWTGLRPVSPDGVALIGATRQRGLFLNTGQGHTGWTVAAASGQLLACAVLGEQAPIDATPYAPGRFGGV